MKRRGCYCFCWRWYVSFQLICTSSQSHFIDGMIIIWAPSNSPQTSTYGSDLSPEDLQYEKEHWKPRTTFRYDALLIVYFYTNLRNADARPCKSMTWHGVRQGNTSSQAAQTTAPEFLLLVMVGIYLFVMLLLKFIFPRQMRS
jgi:hypothetical protein